MNNLEFYTLKGGDFSNAGKISSSIKSILRDNNYPQEIIKRVAIIIYEAEINVVCYAIHGNFFIYFLDNAIKIVIKDKGEGIEDVNLAMQEGFSTASYEIRKLGFGAGMGLSNIKKNSDHFVIYSIPGTGTWLEIGIFSIINKGSKNMDLTIKDIKEKTNFELLTQLSNIEGKITGGYAGDLLSDVNANAAAGNIWITILTHLNTVSLASLKEFSGIIIAGGLRPGIEYIEKANTEKVTVFFTELSTFEVVSILAALGVSGNSY